MDMALGGEYFSKFLLYAIFALAARHLDEGDIDNVAEKGEEYMRVARQLLIRELEYPKPRLPTIQGLLILGGRQCAVGRTSEGWILTGMANRMLTDLGLHLDLDQLARLEKWSTMDLEMRKRLYCSAYIWDKSLSLSLGRPSDLRRISPRTLHLLDCSDDLLIWRPRDFPDHPPMKSLTTTCFVNFCMLGQIIEVLLHRPPRRLDDPTEMQRKLQTWHEHVPASLRIDDSVTVCPPPHVLSLNLLYHTLHIILWRPYMRSDNNGLRTQAADTCADEAQIVHSMFVMHGRSFKWTNMTYLVSYCVYTAATIEVELMKSTVWEKRVAATGRLTTSLQILENEARQTPGISRSIEIIKSQLRTWTPNVNHQAPVQQIPEQASLGPAPDHRRSLAAATLETLPEQPAEQVPRPDTLSPSATQDLDYDWSYVEFMDTGAGFQQNAFAWPADLGDAFDFDTSDRYQYQ